MQRLSIEGPYLIENERRDVTYARGLVVIDRRCNDFQYQLAQQWGHQDNFAAVPQKPRSPGVDVTLAIPAMGRGVSW